LLALFVVLCAGASAQWLNFLVPGTPRLKDGTPNLNAPAPKAADGKPDLSGVWMHEYDSHEELRKLFPNSDAEDKVSVPGMEADTISKWGRNALLSFRPDENAVIKPAAVEARNRARAARDPKALCIGAAGVPLASFLSEPTKIVQSPKLTVIFYESDDTHRQIYTDGRALPKEFGLPAYLGYSVGHWERDTFVVESAGFNDKTPLDTSGHPHTENMRITERYRRRDFGHLDVETIIEDPEYYTKPIPIRVTFNLLADGDIFENFCNENEHDREHMQK